MGCGWGYRFYRNKNEREGPVIYCLPVSSFMVFIFFGLSGVFWGGIRYTLRVFFVRGVKILRKYRVLCFDKEFYLFLI